MRTSLSCTYNLQIIDELGRVGKLCIILVFLLQILIFALRSLPPTTPSPYLVKTSCNNINIYFTMSFADSQHQKLYRELEPHRKEIRLIKPLLDNLRMLYVAISSLFPLRTLCDLSMKHYHMCGITQPRLFPSK